MTSKEKLLERMPKWSEHDAEVALRAVEREHSSEGGRVIDEWGDLDAQTDAANEDALGMLDEEEAAIGFSWEKHR